VDVPWAIDVGVDGAPVVVGETGSSTAWPTTPGAFDTSFNGEGDAFVTKLGSSGSFLEFSTYLGGGDDDRAFDVALDAFGRVNVVGMTRSIFFPTTPDGLDQTLNGTSFNGFLVQLDYAGAALLYGTYLGGTNNFAVDQSESVATGPGGCVCVSGATWSSDFPVTPGAYDTVLDGDIGEAYVMKFDFGPWCDVGLGLAGTGDIVPSLSGQGTLQVGSAGSLQLQDAQPLASTYFVVGLAPLNVPLKGGMLLPEPVLVMPFVTGVAGDVVLSWMNWPAGVPAGTDLYFQCWISDAGGPKGFAASNGLQANTP
jgi:hypothetical protein